MNKASERIEEINCGLGRDVYNQGTSLAYGRPTGSTSFAVNTLNTSPELYSTKGNVLLLSHSANPLPFGRGLEISKIPGSGITNL